MRVVFDTNILLDYLMRRDPFCFLAQRILLSVSKDEIEGFITSNSITDIYYIVKRVIPKEKAKTDILKLLRSLTIINVDSNDCYSAFYHKIDDVEDALIDICAEKVEADYIITRDEDLLKQKTTVKIVSPNDFMLILDK